MIESPLPSPTVVHSEAVLLRKFQPFLIDVKAVWQFNYLFGCGSVRLQHSADIENESTSWCR